MRAWFSLALLPPLVGAILGGCQSSTPSAARPEGHGFPRLIIIGLDGATWDLMDPLMAEGRLPHLAKLRAAGTHGRLVSMKPCISPALWTTIATGKTPAKHAVQGFRYLDENQEIQPINSTVRRARTFWEILGDRGHTSCIVGWWNTWPATPMSGVLISDYLYFARNSIHADRPRALSGVLDSAAYPPNLMPFVIERLEAAEHIPPDMVRTLIDYSDAGLQEFMDVDPRLGQRRGETLSVLKNKLTEMRFHLDVGLELMRRMPTDVYVYYSKGIDATGHKFWKYFEPENSFYAKDPPPPEDVALYGEVVPRFYDLEDLQVERVLEHAGPETYVLVLSDHGHHAGGHSDAPDGIFILTGPGVRAGYPLRGLRIVDIAPLILYLFDLPVGDDMDGAVPFVAFTEEHRKAHPLRFQSTHEKPRDAPLVRLDDEVREALEAELRALGYIE